ncbi:DUF4279 domain-containing protein [Enterococcus hulanensis]|uniref:DUF4279 domain-containing protein n=1 Tax=Enterococcus hulanensis TaxID=2559929 RepID=UPI00288C9046|nr:DUF4279 domain-containing protein [Enterococcus hulanensis]MDT2659220.1 DUF4279 domain-containing protein [Enterococcus hulanensis]
MTDKTSCYTYFSITGDFEPDVITRYLNLQPFEQWLIGDEKKNGRKFDCAAWKFGLCEEYDVFVENQMHNTLKELIPKKEKLKRLKADFDLSFSLEIVPSIYIDEIHPCAFWKMTFLLFYDDKLSTSNSGMTLIEGRKNYLSMMLAKKSLY